MRVTHESRRYNPFFDLVQLSLIVNYIHIISDYILKDKNSRFYKNILYIMFLGRTFCKKKEISFHATVNIALPEMINMYICTYSHGV